MNSPTSQNVAPEPNGSWDNLQNRDFCKSFICERIHVEPQRKFGTKDHFFRVKDMTNQAPIRDIMFNIEQLSAWSGVASFDAYSGIETSDAHAAPDAFGRHCANFYAQHILTECSAERSRIMEGGTSALDAHFQIRASKKTGTRLCRKATQRPERCPTQAI